MQPVIAYNLLQSISLLSNGCRVLTEKCVEGIQPTGALRRDGRAIAGDGDGAGPEDRL